MSLLLEALPNDDKDTIIDYIDRYSGAETGCDANYLLREWAVEKEKLFHVFGDKFILEKEVEINLPENDILQKFRILKQHVFVQNYTEFSRKFDKFYNPEFEHDVNVEDGLWELVYGESLETNKYNGPTFSIPNPKLEGKVITVPTGCKPLRLLGKIASAYDLSDFEDFRIKHSMILNQKKLKGTLCLSIHPLDYMTMSDNCYDWTSCMSWMDGGCYRQGTVEMMNSPVAIVAYLKGAEPFEICGREWSNKKWRELFICSDQVIVGIKGYPYSNYELTDIVNAWLKELMEQHTFVKYSGKVHINPEGHTYLEEEDLDLKFRFFTENMYNDFGCGVEHYGHIPLGEYFNLNYIEINYSGASECMHCGDLNPYFEGEGYLVCDDCCPCEHCEECGEVIHCDPYWIDEVPLCEYCYGEKTVETVDGETHLRYNCYQIILCNEDYTKRYEYFNNTYFPGYNNRKDKLKNFLKKHFDIEKVKVLNTRWNDYIETVVVPVSAIIDNEYHTPWGSSWVIFDGLEDFFDMSEDDCRSKHWLYQTTDILLPVYDLD